jgi:hypothetical protein
LPILAYAVSCRLRKKLPNLELAMQIPTPALGF